MKWASAERIVESSLPPQLFDADALFTAGRGNVADDAGDATDRLDHLLHGFACVVSDLRSGVHAGHRIVDESLDFARCRRIVS